jgi:hypothetical protein
MDLHAVLSEGRFSDSARCSCCAHPAWAHGPGSICSECDASDAMGACGLLALYGFDLAALPLAEPARASA